MGVCPREGMGRRRPVRARRRVASHGGGVRRVMSGGRPLEMGRGTSNVPPLVSRSRGAAMGRRGRDAPPISYISRRGQTSFADDGAIAWVAARAEGQAIRKKPRDRRLWSWAIGNEVRIRTRAVSPIPCRRRAGQEVPEEEDRRVGRPRGPTGGPDGGGSGKPVGSGGRVNRCVNVIRRRSSPDPRGRAFRPRTSSLRTPLPSKCGALSFPDLFSATSSSRQISAVALSTRLNRFAAVVRSRTEANGLSTTLVVRRCRQCFSG